MKFVLFALLLSIRLVSQAQDRVDIHFKFDKYHLNQDAKKKLDSLLQFTKTVQYELQLELNGHCDSKGSNDYNDRLSEKRVTSVMSYLTGHGLNPVSVKAKKGFGERKPLNNNTTPNERYLNRRVEVMISKNETSSDTLSLTKKIEDKTTVAGTNITLENINFYGGMHQFLPESAPVLQELLDAMNRFPNLIIRIEGHICCEEGPADGLDNETGIRNLSEARAIAVRDFLIASGIDSARVSYKGFGHATPIYAYPEKTEEEQRLNRRVEIKILSK